MRTSSLTLCTAESHRQVRRHAPADRNRLVAIAEIIALVAIVISLIVGTLATSAGCDTQARQIAEPNDATSGGISAGTTVEVPTAARSGSTVAYR